MSKWTRFFDKKRSDNPALNAVECADDTLRQLSALFEALKVTVIDKDLIEQSVKQLTSDLDDLDRALQRGAGRELRLMYAPHCIRCSGNGIVPELHESYSDAVRTLALSTLDAMPWREIMDDFGDPESAYVDFHEMFNNELHWAAILGTTFDTSELRIQLDREETAVQDLIDKPPQSTGDFQGYSKPRTKKEWIRVLCKLRLQMGEDKFSKLRRNGELKEHPSTSCKPFSREIRLRLDTLPKDYNDELIPD